MGFIAKQRDLYRVGMKCAESKVDVQDVDRTTRDLPRFVAVSYYEEEFAFNSRNGEVDPHPASYTTIERISNGKREDILTLPPIAHTVRIRGGVRLTFIRKNGLPTTLKMRAAQA